MNEEKRSVAFVTGSSSGFGLLICVALAEAGYYVVASMRNLRKKERLMEVVSERDVVDHIECVELDVTKSNEVDAVIASVTERLGPIAVLVNNAGFAAGGFSEEVPMGKWREQFETNFFGLVAVTKAVVPFMRESQSGMIINMSSIGGRSALPGLGPYQASKFAVEGFSETLRLEMVPYGVKVVLVEPGSFKTDIWGKGVEDVSLSADSPYQAKTERLMKIVKRIAETADDPNEVAHLVARIAQMENPKLRYPIGKGVKASLKMRDLLPWNWVERAITKRM
ncbi:MAG TPA: SDR family oxidoreductase [Bacillales bacterium]|nr:SDR family oxidoreductase [Bacillales bacterium]